MRDLILAHLFGATVGIDAFLLAFKIPNFMRRLFAEGAFSQAFVPVLSEYRTTRSFLDVRILVNKVGTALGAVLLSVSLLGVLGAPWVIRLFAPGFQINDPRFELATRLLQITFPYIFFISLTALAAGIQNTYRRFIIPALTPVFLNISLIGAALLFGKGFYFKEPAEALAWGVLVAGVVQLLFQVPFLVKLALLPRFHWDRRDPGMKRILKLMGPAVLGASVMQVNLLVDTIFASFLPVGSLTWLYYSDRLLELPIGVLGVALATVILPHLSQEYTQKSHVGFSASMDWALRWILLVGVPATLGLAFLAEPLLATLFQYGRFTAHDVIMAGRSLLALSLGLVCFLAVKILVSAFYARQNTRFPVQVALGAMLLNVIFNFMLIGSLAHAGLALASSLSCFFQVIVLLGALLWQKIYVPLTGWWKRFSLRLLLANSALLTFLIWFTPEREVWLLWHGVSRVQALLALIGSACFIYFGTLWITGLRWIHLQLQSSAS